MKAVKLPAIFDAARSRKDRSFRLEFETRELRGDEAATLFGLLHSEGWLLFAPNEGDLDAVDVPTTKADAGTGGKTPSQRLRACLYNYWQQLGKLGDFESWYLLRMERFIDDTKALLDRED
jgi:hypothetical protein